MTCPKEEARKRRADGTKVPSIQAFVEVWKIIADYPDLLKVIRQGGRTGRRDNVVTLLDTHTYDELKEIVSFRRSGYCWRTLKSIISTTPCRQSGPTLCEVG